jgi:integrase
VSARRSHAGVALKSRVLPSGRVQWRARFRDPDTGKIVDVALKLRNAEARRSWAVEKSGLLDQRKMELRKGGPRALPTPLATAVDEYLASCADRLRPTTLEIYRRAGAAFVAWAGGAGVRTTGELTGASLAGFRESIIRTKRKNAVQNGRRGERATSATKLAPNSVNMTLRAAKTMLDYFRVHGLAGRLTSDAISDALKALPVLHEQADYLAPSQISKLLQAAQRHDADTHKITRLEHMGVGTPGSTPKYDSIAPFVLTMLMTGMRRNEGRELRWSEVDLDAVDATGAVVGEIRLPASRTKTRKARTIGLEVSPALRAQLAAMKLRAGKGAVFVFETLDAKGERKPYSDTLIEAARRRLIAEYGSPAFSWQILRSTCATYLTNAPAIYVAASVYMSARQLGHSVQVAERDYLGLHRGIPREARTLEAAMQTEDLVRAVMAASGSRALIASAQ